MTTCHRKSTGDNRSSQRDEGDGTILKRLLSEFLEFRVSISARIKDVAGIYSGAAKR